MINSSPSALLTSHKVQDKMIVPNLPSSSCCRGLTTVPGIHGRIFKGASVVTGSHRSHRTWSDLYLIGDRCISSCFFRVCHSGNFYLVTLPSMYQLDLFSARLGVSAILSLLSVLISWQCPFVSLTVFEVGNCTL